MSTVTFRPYGGEPPSEGLVILPKLQCFGLVDGGAVHGQGVLPLLDAAGTAQPSVPAQASATLPMLQAFGTTSDDAIGFVRLPVVSMEGYVGSTGTIDITYGYGPLPILDGTGTASPYVVTSGVVNIPMLGFYGTTEPMNAGAGVLPALTVLGSVAPPPTTAWAVLYQENGLLWGQGFNENDFPIEMTEGLAVSESAVTSFIASLRDRLGITNPIQSTLETAIALNDAMAVRDTLQIVLHVVVDELLVLADTTTTVRELVVDLVNRLAASDIATTALDAQVALATVLALRDPLRVSWITELLEALDLGDSAQVQRVLYAQLVERMGATHITATQLDALVALVQTLGIHDTTGAAWLADLAETLDTDTSLDVLIARIVGLFEKLEAADTITDTLTVVANVAETSLLATDTDTKLTASAILHEVLEFFGSIVLDGEVWSCWLINTESKGVGRYTNYPFNSFARTPWHTYVGAMDTGLHELGGDDDDGEPINAVIRSALTDFGDRHAKRVPTMYIGYTSGNQVGLKVVSTSGAGHKTEDHYLLEPRTANAMRESRFKVGRGIASVYLGFEIVNIDGSDLELDVVEWLPLQLSRRVR